MKIKMTGEKLKNGYSKLVCGYTLIEMIIYVSVLAIITIVIANTMISFSKSYHDLSALHIVDRSGVDAMERITRDIRAAISIDSANSTFGSSPGVLTLVTTSNSVSTTTKFYIQNNLLKVDINSLYHGQLTISNASVSSLVFNKIDSGTSKAVKVDMTVSATVGNVTKTKTYHSTIILKGL